MMRLISKSLVVIIILAAMLGSAISVSALSLVNDQSARSVLGQFNFTSGAFGSYANVEINSPAGIAVDPRNGKVFVADTGDNRVMRFSSLDALTKGAQAEAVLGQPTFSVFSA